MSKRIVLPILLLAVLALAVPALAAAPDTGTVVGEALKQVATNAPETSRAELQNIGALSTTTGQMELSSHLTPFGAELFRGKFSQEVTGGLDPLYVIVPGDTIAIRIWGAVNQDVSQTVDMQGHIFLPGVGPVRVEGVSVGELNSVVKNAVARVFTSNVEVYTNLQKPQPVVAFVTGNVVNPGRYTGSPRDSILYFLDKAGGINLNTGSFRDVRLMRRGKQIVRLDLYDFLRHGRLNWTRINDGDVIVVGGKGPSVAVMGDVKKGASYEWPAEATTDMTGKELIDLAKPLSTVSHASVSGTRVGEPFQTYVTLAALNDFILADGDSVSYYSDKLNPTISVTVRGAHTGPSFLPVKRSAKLREVLAHIPIDADTANLNGVYLLRKSVAVQQQKSLQDALARLEKAVLTQTSSTAEAAQIRKSEAELVAKYVATARQIQPDGLIVVTEEGRVSNIALESGDVIVVPQKSDVVFISGEVRMPASVVYAKGRSVSDYVRQAGGYSERSSKETLVVRPNGKVEMNVTSNIGPGDQILVMPDVDTKFVPIIKDLSQILYQIAVGARMIDLTTTK